MRLRHAAAGMLGVVALLCVGTVTAVVSASAEARYEARASLRLRAPEPGLSEPYSWATRERERLESHGSLLAAPEGVSFAGVQSVDIELSVDGLAVAVRAGEPGAAGAVADLLVRVAGADLARVGDSAVHDRLRRAELALGLPSPPVAVWPHVPGEPEPGEPATAAGYDAPGSDAALVELVAARDAAHALLRPGAIDPAGRAARITPKPLRDAVEAVALLVAVAALLLCGPPATRLRRRAGAIPGRRVTSGRWSVAAGAGTRVTRLRWPEPDERLLRVVLWLWLLSPLLRRIWEWEGTRSGRPLLVLPIVATVAVVPSLVRRGRHAGPLGRLGGWLVAPVGLAVLVGVLEHGWLAAAVGAAGWVAPAVLAVWAASLPDRSAVVGVVTEWFATGAVVAGGYALFQWLTAPPWDTAWLAGTSVTSFGRPVPFELRAFGTFAAPSTLGIFCAVALVVAAGRPVRHRMVAVPSAAVGLLLSLHRTSWIVAVVGLVVLFVMSRPSARQLSAAALTTIAVVGVAASLPTVRDRIATSASAGLTDHSLGERTGIYGRLLPQLLTDPVGAGFGAEGAGARVATGFAPNTDSALLDVLLVFGVPGGILVLAVAGTGLVRSRPRRGADRGHAAAWSAAVALVVAGPAVNVFVGGAGSVSWAVVLWVALLAGKGPGGVDLAGTDGAVVDRAGQLPVGAGSGVAA